MSDIILKKQTLSSADIAVGEASIQVDDTGTLCTVTVDGVKRYSTGITTEDVQDIVGNMVQAVEPLQATYDDANDRLVISSPLASTSTSGLMSTSDKVKLDGLIQYLVKGTAPVSVVYNNADKSITISVGVASQSVDGLMSKEDKIKLDGYKIPKMTKTSADLYTNSAYNYTVISELTHAVESGKAYRVTGLIKYRTSAANTGVVITAQAANAELSLMLGAIARTLATSALYSGEIFSGGDQFRTPGVADAGMAHLVRVDGVVTATQDTTLEFLFASEVNGSYVWTTPSSFISLEEI